MHVTTTAVAFEICATVAFVVFAAVAFVAFVAVGAAVMGALLAGVVVVFTAKRASLRISPTRGTYDAEGDLANACTCSLVRSVSRKTRSSITPATIPCHCQCTRYHVMARVKQCTVQQMQQQELARTQAGHVGLFLDDVCKQRLKIN